MPSRPSPPATRAFYLVQEALDREGRWRPLEKFPEAICGNSYHHVFLEPGDYWQLYALPRAGSFKTKLRFRLEPADPKGVASLFSSEYEGTIDPSAFVNDVGSLPPPRLPAERWAMLALPRPRNNEYK